MAVPRGTWILMAVSGRNEVTPWLGFMGALVGRQNRMRREVIREFLAALVSSETYDFSRNHYIVFGLLWGLPVPVLGYLIEMHAYSGLGEAPSLADFARDPLHIFLALHPLFFAVVFGTLGTIRLRKTAHIRELLEKLAQEVELLSRANAELQELDRLKDEFLSNVTHELKTPLVTIRGYTDMLGSNRLGEMNRQQQLAVSVMGRNAIRLQEQIDRILAGSRNQQRLQDLDLKDTPLLPLVAKAIEYHTPAANSRGVKISLESPEQNVCVRVDRERMLEVFSNLLSNAIKFTDSGGRVWISIGDPRDNRIPVVVGDTGCGISREAQAHVFDRFRQADGSIRRKYGGSGLGLSIVKQNLEAHDCAIRVESTEGKGTRFLFDLPLAPSEDAAPPSGQTEP